MQMWFSTKGGLLAGEQKQYEMISEGTLKGSLSNNYRMATAANISASADLERMLLERQLNEERLLRELAYKEETLQLFQNQKNLKMDQYQLQVEEEILRLKRRFQVEADATNRRVFQLEREVREGYARLQEMEGENMTLVAELENVTKDLLRSNEEMRGQAQQIQKLVETVRLLEATNEQLKLKNLDMEEEIMVLLQIQADKTKHILILEQNARALNHKVLSLEGILQEIQAHVSALTNSLHSKQSENMELKFIVEKMDNEVQSVEGSLKKVAIELDEATRREKVREMQVKELMRENERLYSEVTASRHKLHDLAITYNFGV